MTGEVKPGGRRQQSPGDEADFLSFIMTYWHHRDGNLGHGGTVTHQVL